MIRMTEREVQQHQVGLLHHDEGMCLELVGAHNNLKSFLGKKSLGKLGQDDIVVNNCDTRSRRTLLHHRWGLAELGSSIAWITLGAINWCRVERAAPNGSISDRLWWCSSLSRPPIRCQ